MIIIKSKDFNIKEKTAIGIGKFDGIHLGHIELISSLVRQKEQGLKVVIFTFDMSASAFFTGKKVGEITTLSEKEMIFDKLGVDILIEFPLNKETAATDPCLFIEDILVKQLNMKYVAAGEDLSFGYKGKGDAKLLESKAQALGYEVNIINKLKYKDRDISSTYVREEIEKGNMLEASNLLGHPYSFAGVVEQGFRLGRTLGFPTMNLYPDEEKILPPMGVYYSKVSYENEEYFGITNIGVRPTVADTNDRHVSIETYLFDFDKDMYGQKIITHILEFKRPEMKFESKEALAVQVKQDIIDGRKYFGLD